MAKILIVDDSPTEVNFVKSILSKAGYEIVLASSASEGIKKADEEMPDLILMDVVMPGMSGFQATRKIRLNQKIKHIPILMLTTKDQPVDKIWGLRNGANQYMIKPPKESELLSTIVQLIKVG